MWSIIESKVQRGQRLSSEEGVYLLTEAPLLELGALAQRGARAQDRPEHRDVRHRHESQLHERVHRDCQFCAFYRRPGDRRRTRTPWTRSWRWWRPRRPGRDHVLLQGGHNPAIPCRTTWTSCARRAGASRASRRTSSRLGDPPDGGDGGHVDRGGAEAL